MSAASVVDGLNEIRWPLAPLLDACELTSARLALLVGVPVTAVHVAARRGLTDVDADQWAIRAGLHPLSVWGWAWVEAATNPAPQQPTSTTAAIADQIRRRIDRGDLQPGDAVPSIKSLALEWGVTTTTAARAVRRLQAKAASSSAAAVTAAASHPPTIQRPPARAGAGHEGPHGSRQLAGDARDNLRRHVCRRRRVPPSRRGGGGCGDRGDPRVVPPGA